MNVKPNNVHGLRLILIFNLKTMHCTHRYPTQGPKRWFQMDFVTSMAKGKVVARFCKLFQVRFFSLLIIHSIKVNHCYALKHLLSHPK